MQFKIFRVVIKMRKKSKKNGMPFIIPHIFKQMFIEDLM